jgi:hypothetical protein
MANLGSLIALCSQDDKKDSNKSVEIQILRFPGNKSKISDLRLRLNSSFIDSPRLKVKILTVGKTLFKSKIHQISKFWTFSEKNCDHKHHQLYMS